MLGDVVIQRNLGVKRKQRADGGFVFLVTSEELRPRDHGIRAGNPGQPSSTAEMINEDVGIEEDVIWRGVGHAAPTHRETGR